MSHERQYTVYTISNPTREVFHERMSSILTEIAESGSTVENMQFDVEYDPNTKRQTYHCLIIHYETTNTLVEIFEDLTAGLLQAKINLFLATNNIHPHELISTEYSVWYHDKDKIPYYTAMITYKIWIGLLPDDH